MERKTIHGVWISTHKQETRKENQTQGFLEILVKLVHLPENRRQMVCMTPHVFSSRWAHPLLAFARFGGSKSTRVELPIIDHYLITNHFFRSSSSVLHCDRFKML
jgi:hypothetical protein